MSNNEIQMKNDTSSGMSNFKAQISNTLLVFHLVLCSLCISPPFLHAQETVRLTVGQSQILDFPEIKRIAVGDATIADVKVVADRRQVMITGLEEGLTNLTVWLRDGRKVSKIIRIFTRDPRVVSRDVKSLLEDAEGITVRVVGDKVLIEGEVYTDRDFLRVERAAELYPTVVNMVQKNQISLQPMVEIDVKIMEVNRGLREDIGFDWQNLASLNAGWNWEKTGGALNAGSTGTGWQTSLVSDFGAVLNIMLTRGWGRVLSNPILVCRSGARANFMAGGQIPVPVSKGLGDIDIQWKDYGVMLNFEPVVDGFGNVSMSINAEISDLDFGNTVEVGGTSIPGVTTRKSETSVNLAKDETLVLSELVTSRGSKAVEKIPVLGSIPIVGELFKSRKFKEDRTEFLLFVTPRLVRPGSIGEERIKRMEEEYEKSGEDLKPKVMD